MSDYMAPNPTGGNSLRASGHEITYDFEEGESKVMEEEVVQQDVVAVQPEQVIVKEEVVTGPKEDMKDVHFQNSQIKNDGTSPKRDKRRKDHLRSLIMDNKALMKYSRYKVLQKSTKGPNASISTQDSAVNHLLNSQGAKRLSADERIKFITGKMIQQVKYTFPVEVRISNLTFTAEVDPAGQAIKTVYNSSGFYHLWNFIRRLAKSESPREAQVTKTILDDINLVLHPEKMYLLLGSPGSGKSSLLKAIAGRLSANSKKVSLTGTIEYNGKTLRDRSEFHIENAVAYIDQLDRHAARLTVEETFEFAYQCKTGGIPPPQGIEHAMQQSMHGSKHGNDSTAPKNSSFKNEKSLHSQDSILGDLPSEHLDGLPQIYDGPPVSRVALGCEMLGLTGVKDTFVGDENVRGVSGGQRRRVTVGEMLMDRTPLLCGDEISTGLDAASTYDMIDLMTYYGRLQKSCRVIALLQPSPETVSLFDDVLVLADGKLLYAGPIIEVQDYFLNLGYTPPDQMDVADFLQVLSTPDAEALWTAPKGSTRTQPYTVDELAECFRKSAQNQKILDEIKAPHKLTWESTDAEGNQTSTAFLAFWPGVRRKYANSFPRSTWLNLKRSLTLWVRDRRVLIANFVKNAIMGVSVGGVFYQTEDVVSILGVLFQSMLFIMLGASTTAPALVDDRVIFKKQYEANFFSSYPFILGRTISQMPQMLMDILVFGSILYFMVGLHMSVASYFIFIAILFCFDIVINQFMAVFAAGADSKATVQLISAVVLLFCILFGGFIVPPNVIPIYYIWLYWWNPFAWAYRALLVLEFRSGDWNDPDTILSTTGFTYGPDNTPFGEEWVGYGCAYMVSTFVIYVLLTAVFLGYGAKHSGGGGRPEAPESTDAEEEEGNKIVIPFVPATVSFEDVCYDVQASKGSEQLRLLSSVNGIFEAGRMCALMGSSGAGKTTLMDVIAMRKESGTVSGDVRINGFPQELVPFRRASGYVEQFDVQTPELTVKETVLFSARLRLDPEQVPSDQAKVDFVDQLLKTLELTSFKDSLVGVSELGGLTFEQKKRLSIAVELAASPSIVFLDEPTSGLDARSACLVVKLLRKIASEGRTICATIHQPSSTVFEMFDDLLLLKKGGQTVYFGELGENSRTLTKYFEDRGANPIDLGENPANWVLTVMTSGETDYAEEFLKSEEFKKTKERLANLKDNPDPKNKIHYDDIYAASAATRSRLTNRRLTTIYWRSPNYNYARIVVSGVIAAILSSVVIENRNETVFSETNVRAQFAVIFLSFIIMGIMSIFSVLPVMLSIRDMFYRHRASGMISSGALGWGLGVAEKWFIVATSVMFVLIFLTVSYNWNQDLTARIEFWGFFTFNLALYSYFGQAFVCFFKPMATAQILSSVFIGLNNFFSGLIVRPQFMTGLFEITYWITPGHYVYEGLITSLYTGDNRTVIADYGTDFYDWIDCSAQINATGTQCEGTMEEYMDSFFGGKFSKHHNARNLIVLGCILVIARLVTYLALHFINFSGT